MTSRLRRRLAFQLAFRGRSREPRRRAVENYVDTVQGQCTMQIDEMLAFGAIFALAEVV